MIDDCLIGILPPIQLKAQNFSLDQFLHDIYDVGKPLKLLFCKGECLGLSLGLFPLKYTSFNQDLQLSKHVKKLIPYTRGSITNAS